MHATDPCPSFTPTHPEAACASPLLSYRIDGDEPGRDAVVIDTSGQEVIWLAASDVEPFIEWLRSCAA